jgi:excisionase family DNA binding protein
MASSVKLQAELAPKLWRWPDMQENRIAISKQEYARSLSVSLDSVNRAIKRGKIRVIRFGRRVLIPKTELDRVLRGE